MGAIFAGSQPSSAIGPERVAPMNWLIWVVVSLAVLIGGYLLYGQFVGNPRVVDEILEDPGGVRAGIVMLLTLPDGKRIPVHYLREGSLVFAGADGRWWRAFGGGGAPATLLIRGETLTGIAHVVLDDQDYVDDVFARLRPNVPKWLPDWLNGKLVVVQLDRAESR